MKKPARDELFDEEFLRRLRHLALAGRRVLGAQAGGAHRATDLGDGLEFADHRDYAPGDELRYVDWNVFGRLDRLQVRLFHRHSEQQIHLLLDCSGSMAAGGGERWPRGRGDTGTRGTEASKEVFAKRCVAGLAYLGWTNLDHVHIAAWQGLPPFSAFSKKGTVPLPPEERGTVPLSQTARKGDSPRELAPLRGRASRFSAVLDYLAELEVAGPASLDDAARRWASRPRPRGLAVLVSDCADLDDLKAALRRLRYAGQQIVVLHVYSPADAGDVPPGPLALIDPEQSGQRLTVVNEPALAAAYRRQWESYLAHVAGAVRAVKGVYAHSSTARPWEQFLLSCLRLMRLAAV